MTNSKDSFLWIKAGDSGMFRGTFLAEVRVESGQTMVRSKSYRKLLA